jgi:spermidine/putrescine ABC transporter ATP-binding subunit
MCSRRLLPTMEPIVELRNVTKRYGETAALDELSLEVRRGEFLTLLGASGSGKTTILRLVAGFEQPDAGEVFIEGCPARDLPPYRRNVNTVFQHYALFPHLTVGKNVAFGLEQKKLASEEIRRRVGAVLELVGLEGKEDRMPNELSGGEKQRVALARALVLEPAVLLLDEPLGALDQKLRREMQVELKRLRERVGITFVFVTHDQEEALVMSDRIAVIQRGRLVQAGTGEEIYEQPCSRYLAEFMGVENFFEATAGELSASVRRFETAEGVDLWAADSAHLPPAAQAVVAVRPEVLNLWSDPPTSKPANFIPGRIVEAIYEGGRRRWSVELAGGKRLVVRGGNHVDSPLARGDAVFVGWDPRWTLVYPRE